MMRLTKSDLYIRKIETAVPPHGLSQAEIAQRMEIAYDDRRALRFLQKLARRTEIEQRHLSALAFQDDTAENSPLYRAVEEQPAGPGMGARGQAFDIAAPALMRDLLAESAKSQAASLRNLITVSCTHASSPGIEAPIAEQLALSPEVNHWHLGFMGCSAGLAALRLARSFAPQQHDSLVVCCELSSLHFQYSNDVDQITANMLFADGAAAVWLGEDDGVIKIHATASKRFPQAADQMTWFADDCGLRLNLSPELPRTLGQHVGEFVDSFLSDNDLRRDDIHHWAVHPGGPQILKATSDALALPDDALAASHDVLRKFGNMSSATIFFILKQMTAENRAGLAVALAFGPGLTIEVCLLEFTP